MNVEFNGRSVMPTDMSVTFHGRLVDDVLLNSAIEIPEREVVITLAHGQSWRREMPRTNRRGQRIVFYIQGERFVGRVRFRRLNKLVCVGKFG